MDADAVEVERTEEVDMTVEVTVVAAAAAVVVEEVVAAMVAAEWRCWRRWLGVGGVRRREKA